MTRLKYISRPISSPVEQDSPEEQEMIRVWDLFIRVFHWSLATAFFIAYLTEDDLLSVHVWSGYLILALLMTRTLWGFIGPQYARWAEFVRSPSSILRYLKAAAQFKAERYLGHNPAGGAMVVGLIISLYATVISGLIVYGSQELSGPLAPLLSGISEKSADRFEDIHEVVANLTLLLVFLHLVGVGLASFQHHENLLRAMFTGFKKKTSK